MDTRKTSKHNAMAHVFPVSISRHRHGWLNSSFGRYTKWRSYFVTQIIFILSVKVIECKGDSMSSFLHIQRTARLCKAANMNNL